LAFTKVWAEHGFEDRRSASEHVGAHWDPAMFEIKDDVAIDGERVEFISAHSQKSLRIKIKAFMVFAQDC
jgi:hypothetical protein